jgi:hypothetical protein
MRFAFGDLDIALVLADGGDGSFYAGDDFVYRQAGSGRRAVNYLAGDKGHMHEAALYIGVVFA